MRRRWAGAAALLVMAAATVFAEENIFDTFPEVTVQPSPAERAELSPGDAGRVIDFCPLADNSGVAVLTRATEDSTRIAIWRYGRGLEQRFGYVAPLEPQEVVSHPQGGSVFLLVKARGYSKIVRYDIARNESFELYRDTAPLSHLLVSTGKFDDHFRLFFARGVGSGSEIAALREDGTCGYPVAGPLPWEGHPLTGWFDGGDMRPPSCKAVPSAVPVLYSPQWDTLFWRDANGTLTVLPYSDWGWDEAYVPKIAALTAGYDGLAFSPNGLYLLAWSSESGDAFLLDWKLQKTGLPGLEGEKVRKAAFTPDGRGVVIARADGGLVFTPVSLPLCDVENAWMFLDADEDAGMLAANGGFFRKTDYEQMYQFYDSEVYDYHPPDRALRPYLVTTDPFYEVLEAAYAGIFFINEKQVAVPRLYGALENGRKAFRLKLSASDRFWALLFENAQKIASGNYDTPELRRVLQAQGVADSPSLQCKGLDYAEFKPRGYYTQSEALKRYFRAVQYLSFASPTVEQWKTLNGKPDVAAALRRWADAYRPFVPAPRSVMPGETPHPPPYMKHPYAKMTLFPKAWGFDNEVLDSVVYHEKWPREDQVDRLLPDVDELAAVFGSSFARGVLEKDGLYEQYPVLRRVHADLQARWAAHMRRGGQGIYDCWLKLVAVQVAGKKPDWPWLSDDLWGAKQLQTGLAGWTNLRHATVLVNERGVAEGGEGGFEYLTHRPPRGYVEPFPEAFAALASIFGELKRVCAALPQDDLKAAQMGTGDYGGSVRFTEGVARHIDNTIANIERFRQMAEKQQRGDSLTGDEYEGIYRFAGTAEHAFLVFKSIMTRNNGLSEPEPMPKVADVAGSGSLGILHAAVGKPLEWDLVVPYYGRRQVVKGAVYSFYEFTRGAAVNDGEWRAQLDTHELPAWASPFVSKAKSSWRASRPFLSR